jgi:hypothetical protein
LTSAARTRLHTFAPIVLFAAMAMAAALLIMSGPGTSQSPQQAQRATQQAHGAALREIAGGTATAVAKPTTAAPAAPVAPPTPATTTTTAAPVAPPPTPAPVSTPAPVTAPAPVVAAPARAVPAPAAADAGAVPPIGQATAWGCAAAVAYLQAYAAKGYSVECPAYAEGHEAMTCLRNATACPDQAVIAISDPCPQAYMNEASNSLVMAGASDAPVDPYGPCL